jgi:hypothetical protein
MFSYRERICNSVGLNVEREYSTAYGRIRRYVNKCRFLALLGMTGYRAGSGAIPRVNEVETAGFEVCDVAGRELSSSHLRNGCNLRIGMIDRFAEGAAVSGDLRKNSRCVAVEAEDTARQILGEHSLGGCQQALAALASGEQFNSIKDFCLGD